MGADTILAIFSFTMAIALSGGKYPSFPNPEVVFLETETSLWIGQPTYAAILPAVLLLPDPAILLITGRETRDGKIRVFTMPGMTGNELLERALERHPDTIRIVVTAYADLDPILRKVTGFEVLRDISDFVGSFSGMYVGFQQRAAKVEALLRDDVLSFLLVTSPNAMTVDEATYFHAKLGEYDLPFGGFVVNRVHGDPLEEYGAKAEWKRMRKDPTQILAALGTAAKGKAAEELAEKMAENMEHLQALSEMDAEQIVRLKKECAGKHLWRQVPFFELDVHDLSGLSRVNHHLFETPES